MNMISKPRVLVSGAGFGGPELTTLLSETFGDGVDVTLIDKSDAFVFGYSKLDIEQHYPASATLASVDARREAW